ncbi:aspartate carbamoyltransferase regulatory subunit [Wansuia hejianensis]|uniref:Aspartate carbamoyltransferase regulatory subunit n=1 Tax=Wansuia hejianensis TaxID=2763667 RepID=A0A926F3F3_9FIRM|nr:aspartate carbamoyltransferase regulatory subunit [Wansuia hejianensis]MBC8591189.1 aspartate carbamoyltransferase regulatory subunit [Wansuia hejianensis]
MLYIDSISNGIVIDHIKPGLGAKIFNYLDLDKVDFTVALIINAPSKTYGRKDLIKIENNMDLDLRILGFIDSNITINIIRDEKISEKINLSLPENVEGVVECKNPRCITSTERNIVHKFSLVDKETGSYKCDYCDQLYTWEG